MTIIIIVIFIIIIITYIITKHSFVNEMLFCYYMQIHCTMPI